jgi:hypothetical protein
MMTLKSGKHSGLLAVKGSITGNRTGIVGCTHSDFLMPFPRRVMNDHRTRP